MKFARKMTLAAIAMLAVFSAATFAQRKAEIKSAADLAGKKIGVQGGTTGETWVNENVKRARVYSFRSGMDAALDLKNGAIDAVVLDELPAREIVARNSDLTILEGAGSFAREEYAIAVKKGNKKLLDSINAAIKKAMESGTYDVLSKSFMPADGNISIPKFDAPPSNQTVKLGTNAAFPPFEYVDGNNIVGFDISMGQLIAIECGAALEVVDMSFDSLIPALSSGAIDFIAAGMSVTEERKKNVDFSIPYFESEQVIIIKK